MFLNSSMLSFFNGVIILHCMILWFKCSFILWQELHFRKYLPMLKALKLFFRFICTEKFGLKHLELVNKYLQIFGGWPVVEGSSWNEKKFDWIELIKQFIKYGFHDYTIFNIVEGVNFNNASQKRLCVSIKG